MAIVQPRSRQRGVTLLESLLAFFVLAAGSVAVAALQRELHLAADVSRERSQALRVAEDDVERLRAFVAIEGPPATRTFAAIASATVDPASAPGATTDRKSVV